jgi:hypothetical protein
MCEKKDIRNPELDCIAEEVLAIIDLEKFKGIMSCCGHGVYPKTLIVKNIYSGFIFDIFSGAGMRKNTTEPYYDKDSLGYYYNKESMEFYKNHPILRKRNKIGILFEKEGSLLRHEPKQTSPAN